MVRCSDEFMNSEFERNFSAASSTFDYCTEDENIYFQGTRDSAVNRMEHAYVIIEVHVCNNGTKKEDDPECATEDEIEEWIATKQIQLKVIDNKIDFTNLDNYAVRQTEKWLPMVPLKKGSFSDTGYRFRKNSFERKDNWYPFANKYTEGFFDMTFFNSDTLSVGHDYTTIAELYFRLETEEVTHQRIVKQFSD